LAFILLLKKFITKDHKSWYCKIKNNVQSGTVIEQCILYFLQIEIFYFDKSE